MCWKWIKRKISLSSCPCFCANPTSQKLNWLSWRQKSFKTELFCNTHRLVSPTARGSTTPRDLFPVPAKGMVQKWVVLLWCCMLTWGRGWKPFSSCESPAGTGSSGLGCPIELNRYLAIRTDYHNTIKVDDSISEQAAWNFILLYCCLRNTEAVFWVGSMGRKACKLSIACSTLKDRHCICIAIHITKI